MPGLYAGGDCTTEYIVNTGSQTGGEGGQGGQSAQQSGGRPRGVVGLFGNYITRQGSGMRGLTKGITTAINIAEYPGKA